MLISDWSSYVCSSDLFALFRLDAMLLQRLDTQRGGIAGGADRHCLLGGEGIRQLDQPFGLDASLLAETAPVAFADAPAVEDDTVADFPLRTVAGFDDTGKIDARHHREFADRSEEHTSEFQSLMR